MAYVRRVSPRRYISNNSIINTTAHSLLPHIQSSHIQQQACECVDREHDKLYLHDSNTEGQGKTRKCMLALGEGHATFLTHALMPACL